MIFYNAGSRFFEMKSDADAHRKELGLKPDALHTLSISNREEMCAFLNGLVSHQVERPSKIKGSDNIIVQMVEPDIVPDYVPLFLLSAEQKKARQEAKQ